MHQPVEPLGKRQALGDIGHDRLVKPLEHRHAAAEALREVDLTAHRALGDRAHLGSDTGTLSQLVDHLGLDQRRVHVEADKPARTAEHVVLLERYVHAQLGRQLQKARLHTLLVVRIPSHRQLDARLGSPRVLVERNTARQAQDRVDIESLLGHDARYGGDLLGRQLAAEHGNDVAVLALHADPLLVLLDGDRLKAYLNAELVGLEQQILHDIARADRVGLEQNAHREGLVDVGLTDIQNRRVVAREDVGQRRGEAGLILAVNIDLNNFDIVVFHAFRFCACERLSQAARRFGYNVCKVIKLFGNCRRSTQEKRRPARQPVFLAGKTPAVRLSGNAASQQNTGRTLF